MPLDVNHHVRTHEGALGRDDAGEDVKEARVVAVDVEERLRRFGDGCAEGGRGGGEGG